MVATVSWKIFVDIILGSYGSAMIGLKLEFADAIPAKSLLCN